MKFRPSLRSSPILRACRVLTDGASAPWSHSDFHSLFPACSGRHALFRTLITFSQLKHFYSCLSPSFSLAFRVANPPKKSNPLSSPHTPLTPRPARGAEGLRGRGAPQPLCRQVLVALPRGPQGVHPGGPLRGLREGARHPPRLLQALVQLPHGEQRGPGPGGWWARPPLARIPGSEFPRTSTLSFKLNWALCLRAGETHSALPPLQSYCETLPQMNETRILLSNHPDSNPDFNSRICHTHAHART